MWKRIKTFFSNLFETEKPNSEEMKRYNTKRICICCGNVYQVKNGSMKYCSLKCMNLTHKRLCD